MGADGKARPLGSPRLGIASLTKTSDYRYTCRHMCSDVKSGLFPFMLTTFGKNNSISSDSGGAYGWINSKYVRRQQH